MRSTAPSAVSAAPSRARGRWWRASAHRARRFGYSNDAAGRRTAISRSGEAFGDLSGAVDAYGYNLRSEVVSARRTMGGASVRGFDEDFSYDPIGNRVSTTNYDETGSAIVSEYSANNLNQYTSRIVPGVAAVRGFADANATVTVNENPAYRLGEYFYGSDAFDNSAAPVDAALVTTAALASPTNGPDEVASVTSRVHIARTPQLFEYDLDGNQTLVTTKTGTWRVTYNGENRPVTWTRINAADTNGQTMISMNFDHQGRRRLYLEVAGDGSTNRLDRFTYDNYLCVARNRWSPDGTSSADRFTWNPTELVATRPLVWNFSTFQPFNVSTCYYAHDGNKNVSELVSSADGSISSHYEYAPFGEVTVSCGTSAATNPWRFSSEYAEDDTATVYYNYRHYEAMAGRWMYRDPIEEIGGANHYAFCCNNPVRCFDSFGLKIDINEDTERVTFRLKHNARGMTSHSVAVTVDCSLTGIIYISGRARRYIELLHPTSPRWNEHFRRYDQKWGRNRTAERERMATKAHEMDHYQSYDQLFGYLHSLNDIDGSYLGLCECLQEKIVIEKTLSEMRECASRWSKSYDLKGRNEGGVFPW